MVIDLPEVGESGWGTKLNTAIGDLLSSALSEIEFPIRDKGGHVYHPAAYGTPFLASTIRTVVSIVDALGGGEIIVPPGDWTETTDGQNGIDLTGCSNITLRFLPGARLAMQNLDGSGNGTAHGIYAGGPAENITIIGGRVVWPTAPSARSAGDGYRFLGNPADAGNYLRNIQLIDCEAENCPQTGAIFMGVSDPYVRNFKPTNTKADGLHFNACRRINGSGLRASGTGDDSLAFVTYQHDSVTGTGPFNIAGLGEWNNTGVFSGIVATDSAVNTVRISGAFGLDVSDVVSTDAAECGVRLDAARATAGPPVVAFTYLASRLVTVRGVNATGGLQAVHAQVHGDIDYADDEQWWRFDATVAGIRGYNQSIDTVLCENVAGVHVLDASGNDNIRFLQTRQCSYDQIRTTAGTIQVIGEASAVPILANLSRHILSIGTLEATGGSVQFQDLRDFRVGRVRVRDATSYSLGLIRCSDFRVADVDIYNPAASQQAILIDKAANFDLYATVEQTSKTLTSVQVGGGDADDVSRDFTGYVRYRTTLNQADDDTVFQGGGFAPIRYRLVVDRFNAGEASPAWASTTYGTGGPSGP